MTSHQTMVSELLESRRLLSASTFAVTNLVSDGAVPAAHTDSHLLNAWGIVFDGKTFRVANNGDSTSQAFKTNGKEAGTIAHVPGGGGEADGAPTGIALNRGKGFVISANGQSAPARFIFVGEDGAITGYNPKVSADAIIGEDSSDEGAVYKGVALANVGKHTFLYAADFHNASINVYNDQFDDATLAGSFKDPNLPDGYAPFNIAQIKGHLFVAFAHTQAGSDDEMAGPGLGVVDEFNNDGTFLRRIGAGGTLNAPWGMAIAPKHFGRFGGDLLVGNFGDGRISAFSTKGKFIGQLNDTSGDPIEIDGLWGIAFGQRGNAKQKLFFAAGTNDEADGLVGVISAARSKHPDSSTNASVASANLMRNLFSSVSMSAMESNLVSILS